MATPKGYTFRNYAVPDGEWGEVLTADDMRFTYLWGIDLKAADIPVTEVRDDQLIWCIEEALAATEKYLKIDIRKRIYKVNPLSTLKRGVIWKAGIDYTDEEDPYDFDVTQWENNGFLQLRHKPVLSVETAQFLDPIGSTIMDLISWMRLYKKPGQINFMPRGSLTGAAQSIVNGPAVLYPRILTRNTPQHSKREYTTGFLSSDFVDKGLRDFIGMYASIMLLNWIGDGLMAGFASSSVGLDGVSESFSSTQSATSAYFGPRQIEYRKCMKDWLDHNR